MKPKRWSQTILMGLLALALFPGTEQRFALALAATSVAGLIVEPYFR